MDNTSTPGNNAEDEKNNSFGPPFTKIPGHTPGASPYQVETAHHATAAVLQKAANVADIAADFVGSAAAFVGQKTDEGRTAAGGGMRSFGDSVRESGPDAGMAGDASSAMADTLDRSGRYLVEESVKDIGEDITDLIRKNPIPAMLVGIAAGFVAGRAMAPRS